MAVCLLVPLGRRAAARRVQIRSARAGGYAQAPSRSRWSIPSSASPSSDFRSLKPSAYVTGILEKEGFHRNARRGGDAHGIRRELGLGQAGDRLHGRYRRPSGNFAEARRGLSRAVDSRRTGPRRRPQRRPGGQRHSGHRGEAADAEIQHPRHHPRLSRRGRGAARQPHLHGERRTVSRSRRDAEHAHRQRFRHHLRARAGRAWFPPNTAFTARARTPPARPGRDAARSMPSS